MPVGISISAYASTALGADKLFVSCRARRRRDPNGLAAHSGAVAFSATFLIFSDYMRPPIRLAAMMKLHVMMFSPTTASPWAGRAGARRISG